MSERSRALAVWFFCGVGLAVSTLLAWQAGSGASALCSVGGGCAEVQASAYSSFLGVPLPALGVAYFVALLGLVSLGAPAWTAVRWLAISGGLVGLALLAIQSFAIGAFCRWCVVVDLSMVALSIIALRTKSSPSAGAAWSMTALGSAAALVVGVAFATAAQTSSKPLAATQSSETGALTITEFIDFECPHCRKMHAALTSVLGEFGESVRVVRHHVPLPQHQLAEGAARAACCAEQVGVADEMADRLFAATDLSPSSCAAIAEDLGIDRDAFEACIGSAAVTERLASDQRLAIDSGVRALPTTFIGDERLEGARDASAVRASIQRALAKRSHAASRSLGDDS